MRDITKCPKCGSQRIAFAHEEAPPWAKSWTKCFACGNRWNLDGGPQKGKPDADDESTEAVEYMPPKVDRSQDLIALVMKTAREQQPVTLQSTKEPVMSGPPDDSRRCREILKSGTRCVSGCKKGEDVCQRHFDKRVGVKRKKRMGGGTAPTAVATVPATRAAAPIVMADPTIINPPTNGHGQTMALSGIEELISRYETDLATLRGAKEILERHG